MGIVEETQVMENKTFLPPFFVLSASNEPIPLPTSRTLHSGDRFSKANMAYIQPYSVPWKHFYYFKFLGRCSSYLVRIWSAASPKFLSKLQVFPLQYPRRSIRGRAVRQSARASMRRQQQPEKPAFFARQGRESFPPEHHPRLPLQAMAVRYG